MPEPISTVGLCLVGYIALNAYSRVGSAISNEAAVARKAACAVVESAEQSYALFGAKAAAISRLRTMANECADENWDGNESCAVTSMAVLIAEDFLRVLSDDIPLPEFAPEPDGTISLDWISSQQRMFSVSVGVNSRLAYAWLDGSDKGHGVVRFDGETVPAMLIEGLRKIVKHGNANIGPF